MGMNPTFYVGIGQFTKNPKVDDYDELSEDYEGLTIITGENLRPSVFVGKIYESGDKYDDDIKTDLSEFLQPSQAIQDYREIEDFLMSELGLDKSEVDIKPMFFNSWS